MNPNKLVPLLLDWFAYHARDLPWRRTRDPYAIWVSEIMLQQTQVDTVIPFWERWMRALPSIRSLARANPQKIHKLWEGLGYYTRVRNLQKAARLILEKHNGRFPTDYEDILELPGIGRYTAGAICSIAFNLPCPILDGNVIRVLTRLYGIDGAPRDRSVNERLWELAQRLVEEAHTTSLRAEFPSPQASPQGRRSSDSPLAQHPPLPWDKKNACLEFSFRRGENSVIANRKSQIANGRALLCSHLNQSLMELGALVCTPRQPRCDLCPLSKLCVARRENRVEFLPKVAPRPNVTKLQFVAFVARRNSKILVRQRPAGALNAHLWEFPNVEVYSRDGAPVDACRKLFGIRPSALRHTGTIRHSITRYRIRLDVFEISSHSLGKVRPGLGCWLRCRELHQLPFASAHKKILASL
jgi:A/G-specific adenine glycosylase